MAENSVSQLSPFINDNSSMEIGLTPTGLPAVRSDVVARHFQKKHKNILREIDRLCSILPKSFTGLNFEPSSFQDSTGRTLPAYLLTRDAFSLLVMGFTGRAAMLWKLRYIEAFNALERAALERGSELAREAGYTQGWDEAMSLPALEVERKKAYLAGLREGRKYRAAKDGLTILKKILAYRKKGLSYAEIGKILDMGKFAVAKRLERARKAGLVLEISGPVQGNLLEA